MHRHAPGDRKKILIVSTNADWAGAPVHVLTLANALASRYELSVVFGEEGPVRQALLAQGIPSTVVPTLRSSINPIRDIRCFFSFLKLVRVAQPDLLHAHSSKAGMITRLAAAILHIPCIYTVHGWGFGPGRSRLQSALVYGVERMSSHFSRATYIFVSDADRRVGTERLRLRPDQCHTIRNGTPDHGQIANVAQNSAAIMAARVCHAKDHDLLLRSFQECRTPFKLVLVGEGTQTPEFQQRVRAHAPDKHTQVACLGLSESIPSLLARAGMFVLCSRYEGLPLSIIEAMCAGLPIVATDVGGVGELVEDGVNGFLVPPGDQPALSRCLDLLQSDAALRVRMGQASRARYVAEFEISRMASAVVQMYNKMLYTV